MCVMSCPHDLSTILTSTPSEVSKTIKSFFLRVGRFSTDVFKDVQVIWEGPGSSKKSIGSATQKKKKSKLRGTTGPPSCTGLFES